MPEKNIKPLILGDGLLGTELVKQTGWNYISRKKDNFDFCDILSYYHLLSGYGTIINCIANTDTYSEERKKHWDTNFVAVCDLVEFCNKKSKKLIQISTDYIYGNSTILASENDIPVHCDNWYSYTKNLADGYVQAKSNDYLLIRTSFKKNPFPYDKAFTFQHGNFNYVNIIAELIIKLINKNAFGVYNVGTEKPWTIYEMALETKPDVLQSDDLISYSMPENITMDTRKMRRFLNEN
jgi:dTDP-4-dehydrorhamnose reductase